jgi:uncharacterized damage-inducible protein DinB
MVVIIFPFRRENPVDPWRLTGYNREANKKRIPIGESMRISDTLLPEFDQEIGNTRKCLKRIPDDKFSYKPHPKSFDLHGLTMHIATMLQWGVVTLQEDSFDYAPVGGQQWKPPVANTSAELMAIFDKGLAEFRAALAATDDPAMMTMWTLQAGGKTIFSMPRIAVLRGMILNHLVHHRGQLTVYMRMCEIPVPAIYGPSADES